MPTVVVYGMQLVERERRALALVARGHTDRQIARDLEVSIETAKRIMHCARTKLGARNRSHAVAIAMVMGHIKVTRGGGGR